MFITYQKEFRFAHDARCKLFTSRQLGSKLFVGHDYRIDFPAKFLVHIRQGHHDVSKGYRPDDTDIHIAGRPFFPFGYGSKNEGRSRDVVYLLIKFGLKVE